MTVTTTAATADRTTLLTSALMLAERGMHVFPLKPGTKVPALYGEWEQRATTDPTRIRRCWSGGPYNIGVACGPSGLLVVDCDTPKPETPPPSAPFNVPGVNEGADVLVMLAERYAAPFPWGDFHVVTGRGGMHLYFRQPDGPALRNTAGRLGWLIDTRGAGGYVVGPGSIVDGKPYRAFGEPYAEPLPGWLARLLTAPKQRPVAPTRPPNRPAGGPRQPGAYAAKVLREELATILAAKPGTRNDTLNKVAFNLGTHAARGTVPEDLARDTLDFAVGNLSGDVAKSEATARRSFEDGLQKGAAPR
ncbi:bifunctional DNA primase/polymerase [Actinospica sp. MGRD01-02]|uniref:Bifunctional DNA primase/polymerase n=1 Tax=Actinospica acidithermotolerans TaxID=2828514 RepID=A0A941EHL5_9ACTN|nr:bifunctional DNA primase/polymerase [Actinospica acidithermotolerans]MBR7829254.1 bifunctional DNA primase/polymerase [Actinospica acidithermotolerans]